MRYIIISNLMNILYHDASTIGVGESYLCISERSIACPILRVEANNHAEGCLRRQQ